MDVLLRVYLFIVGAAFGSFALAMVDRMKAKKDWVRGRSECSSCKKTLQAVDLVPILSWLSTGGRCRYCHVRLSSSYPLVELLSATLFTISYLYIPYDLIGAVAWALFSLWLVAIVLLVALVVFDSRWFLLPNTLIYPLIAVSSMHWILFVGSNDVAIGRDLINVLLAMVVGAGLFLAIYVLSSGKWIGDGDIRLAVAMGFLLPSPLLVWLAIFVASVTGLLPVIPSVFKKKPLLKLKIPFGPFLIIGLVFAYLFGQVAIDWYSISFLMLQ